MFVKLCYFMLYTFVITHSLWYETAPTTTTTTAADASELRIREQSKKIEYSQQSGPISHIVWTDSILIFISVMVF